MNQSILQALAQYNSYANNFMHSAQHGGELSILLSALGYPLPIDDIIVRFTEERGQP